MEGGIWKDNPFRCRSYNRPWCFVFSPKRPKGLFSRLWDHISGAGLEHDGFSHGYNGWYLAAYLDLGGNWDDLWTTFVKGLSHGGIKLRNSEDTLLWMYDKKSGPVLAKKSIWTHCVWYFATSSRKYSLKGLEIQYPPEIQVLYLVGV